MSKALLRKSLYLPKLEFNQSSWEALSDFERRFLLSQAVDNQEKKFIEGFFAYDKSRPAADIDRQTFLDVLARATQENRLMLVDIIFSANPEEFHIALANHLWHTVFNEESRKMIWLYLSAEKKGMKKAANILDILYAGEAINRDHPLTWPNKDNYVLQNTDRQKYPQILDYALYSKDAALLNNILSLYEVGLDREYAQSESRPNPNGVMFEGSDHPNAILAFTILADAKAQQLQGIAQIKRLWRQIDPGSQKILWFQSLKRVGDVPEDEDACNARVNRMHNILIACQNDTVDENHPLTWIEDGDKALPHFAIMQNLLRDKLPNHDVMQKSWKKLGADVQKMIWFKVVTRGEVGAVGNIINLYRDQPIDENHPLEWRDEKDRNALYAILFSKNINNQVVKKLLETGSFPSQFVRDENAIIYDGIDDESRR
ncbi:MAG: hypothetical protein EXR06_00335, partial [Rickettsiales bacterium]|nr:hypothetical protein [Rickettsiales bacterium]